MEETLQQETEELEYKNQNEDQGIFYNLFVFF